MIKPNSNKLDSSNDLNNIESLAGIVILAGGNSRRMGTPKANLTLPSNERLLDYHVRQAIKLQALNMSVPIMIADNGRDFAVNEDLLSSTKLSSAGLSGNLDQSIFHIADYNSPSVVADSETEGPLVAIESALQALAQLDDTVKLEDGQSSWLMVISCDSLISAYDLWQSLSPYTVAEANDKAVICLTDESHLYPLLGLYKVSIEPELKAYIDSGKREVMVFMKPMTQAIPVAKEWQPLTNLNTPDDFKRACAALTDL